MRFERNFPKNGYLNCFGLGLPCEIKTSYGNFKNTAFCLDRQYILGNIILLTILPTGIGSKNAHLQFRDIALEENQT